MGIFKYYDWDGTQNFENITADEVISKLSDDLLSHGNLSYALRRSLQYGMDRNSGDRLKGIHDLQRQLKKMRQKMLDKYNLSSVIDDIQKKLDDIVNTEREGIEKRLQEALNQADQSGDDMIEGEGKQQKPSPEMLDMLQKIAERNLSRLDNLPEDPGGKIKDLSNYDFLDADARQKFDELMQSLQQQMMDNYFNDLSSQIQKLTPEDLAGVRQMVEDLNEMMEQKMRGEKPDFKNFMQKHGQYFPEGAENLDDLVRQMRHRAQQMQNLMESLPEDKRKELEDMMQSVIKDEGLRSELTQLAYNLEMLAPSKWQRQEYPFRGDDPLSLTEAMRLMDELQKMDDLDRQLNRAQHGTNADHIDEDLLRQVMGDEAARDLEQLKKLTDILEEEGYIWMRGDRYELTPKGMRKIGQKALEDIFSQLKKDGIGKHPSKFAGSGGERTDDLKRYEFGDPFHLHLEKTLSNALRRESGLPVKLTKDDFEVYQTTYLTESATVLMLDISWSMGLRGSFFAAKKVALALSNLIKSQYPRDSLYLIGFSRYAKEMKTEALAMAGVDEYAYGTNMQQAFALARKLLARHKGANRQVIMISDGEPTAHMEGGHVVFEYPPSPRTIDLTLMEVKRCTQAGIVINSFMLERNFYMMQFIDRLTKMNRGRAFYTSPDQLGKYVLVDYLSNKRRKIG